MTKKNTPLSLDQQLKQAVAEGNLDLAQKLLSQLSAENPKPKPRKGGRKPKAAKAAETPKKGRGRPKKNNTSPAKSAAKRPPRLEADDPARYDQILEDESEDFEFEEDAIDIDDYVPTPVRKSKIENEFAMPKRADFANKTKAKSISLVKKNRKMTFLSGQEDKIVDKETGKVVLGADKKTKAILARTDDEGLWEGMEPSERRDAAKKIKVKCRDCNRPFLVYASQLTPSVDIDASEQSYKFFYRCPDCCPVID